MKQNQIILAIAAQKLVEAYGKLIPDYRKELGIVDLKVAADAPCTYEALRLEYERDRVLRVTDAFSSTAIYGIAGNVTFRVFHDCGHLLYDAEFTTEQEVSLAKTQWLDIAPVIEPEWRSICKVVYMADTVEQSLYEARTGKFPDDQKGFVLGHLTAAFNEGRL
ncbi:hypothetical protein PsPphi15_gp02 [Pseudomonas phage phi15]|uniref:Uncharacterized protein n=1 Tax=Pseudomonas phage phi15 TaxID=988656 RepID=F0V6W3_9CAUD|nr:hypothetical protein PsPphi15_gp02 [Pseudomonas phage phi15]CBZ41975.1 hypothetical protein [Pseudomonas phage phi15]